MVVNFTGNTNLVKYQRREGDGSSWTYSPDAEEKLSKLKLEEPPRLFRDGDMILVPIFLPLSTERDGVLKVILAQIDEVITSLGVNI
jgi:hypothetical protein